MDVIWTAEFAGAGKAVVGRMELYGLSLGIAFQIQDDILDIVGDAGTVEEAIAGECCDDLFDIATLEKIAAANRAWGTSTGLSCCDVIAAWMAGLRSSGAFVTRSPWQLLRSATPRGARAGRSRASVEREGRAAHLAHAAGATPAVGVARTRAVSRSAHGTPLILPRK